MPAPDLTALYLRAAGASAVPDIFHRWVCLSLVSACVANQVGVSKFADEMVSPGLYVVLIGDSGSGKGRAVRFGLKIALDVAGLNVFSGETTLPAFIDELVKYDQNGDPAVWLVQEELSSDLGYGEEAERMLRFLTKVHGDQTGAIRKATVTRGPRFIRKSISVNWLAASTEAWFRQAIRPALFEGGFAGRLSPVIDPAAPRPRLPWPIQPPDFVTIRADLVDRFSMLVQARGQFAFDPDALDIHHQWHTAYYEDEPGDPQFKPWWVRADDMFHKLMMLEALLTWVPGDPLLITAAACTRARQTLAEVETCTRQLVHTMGATPKTQAIFDLERTLSSNGHLGTPRYLAHQRMRRRGYDGEETDRAFACLEAERLATSDRKGGRGGVWWRLLRRRASPGP